MLVTSKISLQVNVGKGCQIHELTMEAKYACTSHETRLMCHVSAQGMCSSFRDKHSTFQLHVALEAKCVCVLVSFPRRLCVCVRATNLVENNTT